LVPITGADRPTPKLAENNRVANLLPGLAVSVALGLGSAAIAWGEQALIGVAVIEALVIAIILGVVVRNTTTLPASTKAGIAFASKPLLELAVALLGTTVDLRQVGQAGPALIAGAFLAVATGLPVSYGVGRLNHLPTRLAVLVATGSSVCGNSAIAAVAPVIGADKRDVASAIGLTAVIGCVALLALPYTVALIGLTVTQYGVIVGMSIYAVPQVVAAALPVGVQAARVALLVKLMRVMLLGPVVVVFGLIFRSRTTTTHARLTTYLPWFVIAFFVAMGLKTSGLLPTIVTDIVQVVYVYMMIIAMAALGLGVEIAAVRQVGWRVGLTTVSSLLYLIILGFVVVFLFRV
jgi:uncharacterized integral membrane protein (TIGR00698 family)